MNGGRVIDNIFKELNQKYSVKSKNLSKKLKQQLLKNSNVVSSPIFRVKSPQKKIVVLDNFTFQPIQAAAPKESRGFFKHFKKTSVPVKKQSIVNKNKMSFILNKEKFEELLAQLKKPKVSGKKCPPGKVLNPKTGRCVNDKQKQGKVLKRVVKKAAV